VVLVDGDQHDQHRCDSDGAATSLRQHRRRWRGGKRLNPLAPNVARHVNEGVDMMNRLDTIATRQRKSRSRDLVFAACVALATMVGMSSVALAASVAATHVTSR
jgi:hypothetical protein